MIYYNFKALIEIYFGYCYKYFLDYKIPQLIIVIYFIISYKLLYLDHSCERLIKIYPEFYIHLQFRKLHQLYHLIFIFFDKP